MQIDLRINSEEITIVGDGRETLLHLLRDRMGLRGTKHGCGEGECGACTVLLNGRPVTSCTVLAGQAHGQEITTIEGVEKTAIGALLLDAFEEHGAVQCGFCSPGFVMSALHLLRQNSQPDRNMVRDAISGNFCRCTGYKKIVDAIGSVRPAMDTYAGQATDLPAVEGVDVRSEEFVRVASLQDVLELIATDHDLTLISGGTDICVRNAHSLKVKRFVDLTGLAELNFIRDDGRGIAIGAATTYSEILESPVIQTRAGILIEAAKQVGAGQIQSTGTLGGNIVNASPAADGVAALVALGAIAVVASKNGARHIPVELVATGPGRTTLVPGELIKEIILPLSLDSVASRVGFFQKFGPRQTQTISIASVAFDALFARGNLADVRISLGAVGPTVCVAHDTARLLMSEPLSEALIVRAGEAIQDECSPIDDIRGSARFRRQLVRGLLIKGLLPMLRR
ncbi:MAG: FAD binding domain-containing protein [Rhodobacterales bacterium]|nr:FAD binding domain-containing protein [Rhodobacterales bacterium]